MAAILNSSVAKWQRAACQAVDSGCSNWEVCQQETWLIFSFTKVVLIIIRYFIRKSKPAYIVKFLLLSLLNSASSSLPIGKVIVFLPVIPKAFENYYNGHIVLVVIILDAHLKAKQGGSNENANEKCQFAK